MGGMLSQPVVDKRSNHGEGLGLRYGLTSMQGWRSEMEDAHDVQIGLRYGLDDWSYFAVFDGHAGKRAAILAALNLLEFILRDNEFKLDTSNLPDPFVIPDPYKAQTEDEPSSPTRRPKFWSDYINNRESVAKKPASGDDERKESDASNENDSTATNTAANNQQKEQPGKTIGQQSDANSENNKKDNEVAPDGKQAAKQVAQSVPKSEFVSLPPLEQLKKVESAIRSGFLRIDQRMREEGCDMSGCTAVCTFISPTHLFIANCGDSRAVLHDGTYAGKDPKFATEDHKPSNPRERTRIIKAGGCATQRINGTLAVSRALGDFEFKKDSSRGQCEQLVSPEPEVTVIQRNPEDEFLILACDGIWDVLENRELCEFVQHQLKIEPDVVNVCSAVLDVCLHRGSRDNMSIIIVVFENGPKFTEEARARERENDKVLVDLVRKHGSVHDEFSDFFHSIRFLEENSTITSLPDYLTPGVGLYAKFDMIHEIFENEFEDKPDPRTDCDNPFEPEE